MHKIILLCQIGLVCLTMCFRSLYADNAKLTIFITVHGLNRENIEKIKPFLEKGGLRKIESEAMHCSVSFPHEIYGGVEALTTILTGTTPNIHTINHNERYDKNSGKIHETLYDKDFPGIGTEARLSPKNILASTFSDAMRIKYGKSSKIYAIGIDPQVTIVMAGHCANACCWLDSAQGQWVTTTFYPLGLPQAADNMNMENYIYDRLNTTWSPQMDISAYLFPTKEEQAKKFKYKKIEHFYHTPGTNDIIIDLALQLQKSAKMGKDNIPDFLFLELTTMSPLAHSDNIASAEQEEMYLCLNQSLYRLMQRLNARIGENNYKIVLLGLPHRGIGRNQIEKVQFKHSQFNVNRAAALTSSYLVAMHGNKQWIKKGYGNSIYLNKTEIKRNGLNIYEIQNEVADFLMEFEGVQIALPFRDALLHPFFQKIINKYHFGDVIFSIEPYCQLFTKDNTPYDYVYTPNPTALMWIWEYNKSPIPDYMQIEATQCIDFF